MNEPADAQLLRAYGEQGHEEAFRLLVSRYTDLVYSAALRQVQCPAAAADITQGIFVDLARKATAMADRLETRAAQGNGTAPVESNPGGAPSVASAATDEADETARDPGFISLASWLHRSTRYASLNHLRAARRRSNHERHAMDHLLTHRDTAPDWNLVEPVLDEALDALDDREREAVLLRFFQKLDFRSIGNALGISDDAAQKRVSRALDSLRGHLVQRNLTLGATALASVLTAHAVQAAPAELSASVAGGALGALTQGIGSVPAGAGAVPAAAAVATGTAVTTAFPVWKVLVGVAVATLTGTAIYQGVIIHRLKQEIATAGSPTTPSATAPSSTFFKAATDPGPAVPEQTTPGVRVASSGPDEGRAPLLATPPSRFGPPDAGASASGSGGFGAGGFSGASGSGTASFGSGLSSAPAAGMAASGRTLQAAAATPMLATRTVNGQTIIVFHGKEYPVGPTRGSVTTRARSLQGREYAAAFDGERVLWENVPGAADQVR